MTIKSPGMFPAQETV